MKCLRLIDCLLDRSKFGKLYWNPCGLLEGNEKGSKSILIEVDKMELGQL